MIAIDALRQRVLDASRREAIVTGHPLISHHHVVLDPAYVHITQASLAETARLKALMANHDVYSACRYGGWTYCSIEDDLIETRALAQQLSRRKEGIVAHGQYRRCADEKHHGVRRFRDIST